MGGVVDYWFLSCQVRLSAWVDPAGLSVLEGSFSIARAMLLNVVVILWAAGQVSVSSSLEKSRAVTRRDSAWRSCGRSPVWSIWVLNAWLVMSRATLTVS